MARDIKKPIEEYRRKFTGRGKFTLSDTEQIALLAKETTKPGDHVLFNAILYALEAGYIIGFRAGQRKEKNHDTA